MKTLLTTTAFLSTFCTTIIIGWYCYVGGNVQVDVDAADVPTTTLLKSEWTTPLKVGDTVPKVTFQTRVRIESDDENPFDWKGEVFF
jgi:hypothetical protein